MYFKKYNKKNYKEKVQIREKKNRQNVNIECLYIY